jgi:hypothetical protein
MFCLGFGSDNLFRAARDKPGVGAVRGSRLFNQIFVVVHTPRKIWRGPLVRPKAAPLQSSLTALDHVNVGGVLGVLGVDGADGVPYCAA